MVATVVGAIAVSGCRNEVVPIDVQFRQEHSFLMSVTGRVAVFEPTGASPCSELLGRVTVADFGGALYDSGSVPACAIYNGEVFFEELPDRRLAFVAVSYDRDGTSLISSGCALGNARSDELIQISMGLSEHYTRDGVALQTPECMDPMRRCNDTCN